MCTISTKQQVEINLNLLLRCVFVFCRRVLCMVSLYLSLLVEPRLAGFEISAN